MNSNSFFDEQMKEAGGRGGRGMMRISVLSSVHVYPLTVWCYANFHSLLFLDVFGS